MLKLAVVGANGLLGRDLVEVLETHECSVLPLSAGPISKEEEEDSDVVVFAPSPALLEGLDLVILADTPADTGMLDGFRGRVLDLRGGGAAVGEMWPLAGPLAGTWPAGVQRIKGRPALEQAVAMVPSLVDGVEDLSGVHLSSVASLGERGIRGLEAQSRAILAGVEPDEAPLGYRAAFEAVPMPPRGRPVECRMPVFHGDILILSLARAPKAKPAPEGAKWLDAPPTSREAAVTNMLLAHFAPGATAGDATLTLGFDPILWGALRPAIRLLGLETRGE
jgi:hypothetical protein